MLLAYFIWGVHPVYWKQIDDVPSMEVLHHRVIWCFIASLVALFCTGTLKTVKDTWVDLCKEKKIGLFILAAVMLNINWLANILAVQSGHIVESSLGSYINPLVNVLLGVIFLREKLSNWQKLGVFLAFLGVLNIGIYQGQPPWISLGIAFSFGLYGLLKKKIGVKKALSGMALESAVMCFFSVPYLLYLWAKGMDHFFSNGHTAVLLMGAGLITLIPLLLFSMGVLLLPLSIAGFLQYLNPTIQLVLGVWLYQENFSMAHGVSFSFIWLGVLLFSLSDRFHFHFNKKDRGMNQKIQKSDSEMETRQLEGKYVKYAGKTQ